MLGADYYQTESEIASLLAEGKVPMGIGENTKIRFTEQGIEDLLFSLYAKEQDANVKFYGHVGAVLLTRT